MNRRDQLQDWAEKALEFYNKTALVIDLPFYQFQKPADFDSECDLLLIGLNPGNRKEWESWACQFKNYDSNWYKPVDGKIWFDDKGMNEWGFLAGNPVWDKEWSNSQWKILKGLSLIGLVKDKLDGIKNWQYINYIPFSTENIKEFIDRASEKKIPLDNFVDITTEYIRLLSPKRILFVGTKDGIDRFESWKDKAELGERKILLQGGKRFIIRTSLCGIPTFAIPHPSYPNWPIEARNEMAHMIGLFLEGKEDEIEAKNLDGRPRPSSKHVIKEAFNILVNKLEGKHYLNVGRDDNKYMFQINDIIQFRITAAGKGYMGVRHADYDGKNKYHTGAYAGTDEYRNKLAGLGFKIDEDVWLGTKSFAKYGSVSDEIAKAIESDIDVLQKELGDN